MGSLHFQRAPEHQFNPFGVLVAWNKEAIEQKLKNKLTCRARSVCASELGNVMDSLVYPSLFVAIPRIVAIGDFKLQAGTSRRPERLRIITCKLKNERFMS
jgi:hypothetical protein